MLIPITEEFNEPLGSFALYDAYDVEQKLILRNQKHTDLRVFQNDDVSLASPIVNLNSKTMAELNTMTMLQIQGGSVVSRRGENWSSTGWSASGNVGPDSTRKHMSTLRYVLTDANVHSVFSTMVSDPVDLSAYDPDDFISIALPTYSSTLTAGSSFFLSDGTNTVTKQFGGSLIGSTELRYLVGDFSALDLSNIVTVGFNIRRTAGGNITFTAMSIRALSKDWKAGSVDTDTRYGRLRRTPPRDGNLSLAPEFENFIYWRSSNPPEDDDPMPIDGSVGVIVNSGSVAETNSVNIYFRELTKDFMTQADLNGTPQSELNGQPQPNIGEAKYNINTQADLGIYTMAELDGKKMFDLERQPDNLSSSYVYFSLQWNSGQSTITISNSEETSGAYTFQFNSLAPNKEYLFIPELEENKVRASVYELDVAGNVVKLVYDTFSVIDSFAFKRRKGRVGWYATLRDGDAYVDSIRDRGFTYAEYKSKPYESTTPVVGAELFVGTSPNIEHFEFFAPGFYNRDTLSNISKDTARSTSGESWKVTDFGYQTFQGVQSNEFLLSDVENTEVAFDIYYPQAALDADVRPIAFLFALNGARTINLLMPEIVPDQWQRVRIRLPTDEVYLTGGYRLLIGSAPTANTPFTWWVDSPTIYTRSVAWEGRAIIDDPWFSNEAHWTPYRNVINRESGGVLFPIRGNQLQVRAKALSQTASISRIQFKPKYAELGQLVNGQVNTPSAKPTASFTSSVAAKTVSFTSTSTDPDGYIANVEWNFGDGAYGIGAFVQHTYASSGSYSVTITVTDNNGNRTANTSTVGV